jgi:predicted phosphodiesterase
MRVLVISDIHANLQALEAVLNSAPPHDAVWNLGDLVGYGANPNEVIAQVQQHRGIVVRGNHDRAAARLTNFSDFSFPAARAIEWTQAILQADHYEWLRNLAAGPVKPDGAEASCVHGSPIDEDQYLDSAEDAWPSLKSAGPRITFFGHTHKQRGFATNGEELFDLTPHYGSRDDQEEYELPLRNGAHYLLNPGSVGQPRDGDWRAAYAIYDSVQSLLTWHRTPYPVLLAQQNIRDAGLPAFLADRLQLGR